MIVGGNKVQPLGVGEGGEYINPEEEGSVILFMIWRREGGVAC